VLAAVEAHFAAALKADLGQATPVLTGPLADLPTGSSVHVSAGRLALAVPPSDLVADRNSARLFTAHTWPSDGQQTGFPLPPGAGELAEVEAPPGRPRRRGDDFRVDAGALNFYRPPAAGQPGVKAMFLGQRAAGYHERRAGELALLITARAAAVADLDALAAAALAAALKASVAPPTFEAPPVAGVRVRLLRAAAALSAVVRRTEARGDVALPRCDLEFVLRGEAELLIALGAPEPESIIAAVEPGAIDIG
jgi:hypothetical protein